MPAKTSLAFVLAAVSTTSVAIPYKVLSAFQTAAAQANDAPGLKYTHVSVLLESIRRGVQPQTIVLTIHSQPTPRTFSPGRNGILVVPANPSLTAEDPDVTTNQPKGTLSLGFKINVEAHVAPRFQLSLADDMVADYNRARAASPLLAKIYTLKPRYLKLTGNNITASTTCGIKFARVLGGAEIPITAFPGDCVVSTTGLVTSAELRFAR